MLTKLALSRRLAQSSSFHMPMSRNEAQTRFELIDPMLIDQRGWRREDMRLETTAAQIDIVYGKGQRRPLGRTDYLLCRPFSDGTEPIPLAILEAKREGLPPEHGLQQGKGYRIGKLHHVPFVFSSNGHHPTRFGGRATQLLFSTRQKLS